MTSNSRHWWNASAIGDRSRGRRLADGGGGPVTTGLVLVMVAGAAFASRIELPLLARFALARPAFDRVVAERVAAGDHAELCPAWIGTYRIGNCRTVGTDTYFTERDGGFLNGVGFAYLPEGPPSDPPTVSSITYGQLRGSWYWYVEEW